MSLYDCIKSADYRILESLGILLALLIKVSLYSIGIAVASYIFVHTFLFLMSHFHPELGFLK